MSSNEYTKARYRIILTSLVMLGAINCALTSLGYNFIEIITKKISLNFPIHKIICLIIIFSVVLLAMQRETWLPFLGESILPENLVTLQTPKDADKIITINTLPNVKIAYWAATGSDDEQDVISAYGDYSNSGVIMSDNNGNAEIRIKEGSGYKVPSGKQLSKHVHYRVLGLPYAMMGKIETVNY